MQAHDRQYRENKKDVNILHLHQLNHISVGVAKKRTRPSSNLNLFGPYLGYARLEHGWTQAELAVKLQLAGWSTTRDILTRIETGKRSLLDIELVVMSKVLKVSIDQMVADIDLAKTAQAVPNRNKRWHDDD